MVLIEVLADSLNYGYGGHRWRVLDQVNGKKVRRTRGRATAPRHRTAPPRLAISPRHRAGPLH